MECEECGATAFEVPDETGRTWCASCGAEAPDLASDDAGEDADSDETDDDSRRHWRDSLPGENPARSRYGRTEKVKPAKRTHKV